MSGVFKAQKREGEARVNGRIKMAETSVSGTDISISITSV